MKSERAPAGPVTAQAPHASRSSRPSPQGLRRIGSAAGNMAVQGLLQRGIQNAMADCSPGAPLDSSIRAELARDLGRPLDSVRVHNDSAAAGLTASLDARAFTRGDHIYFSRGRYQPQTPEGRRLIAHEAAHTVQQSGAASTVAAVSEPDSPLEAGAIAMTPAPGSAPVHIQRDPEPPPDTPPRETVDPIQRYPGLMLALDDVAYTGLRNAMRHRELTIRIRQAESVPNPDEAAVRALRDEYNAVPVAGAGQFTVPLTSLLAADTTYTPVQKFGDQMVNVLRAGGLAFDLMRNEAITRFMRDHYSGDTAVSIGVNDPDALTTATTTPRIAIGKTVIESADGYIHLRDLDRAAGLVMEGIANDIAGEAAQAGETASLLVAGGNLSGEIAGLPPQILAHPENYSRDEVVQLKDSVADLHNRLSGAAPGSFAGELRGMAQTAASIEGELGRCVGAVEDIRAKHPCQTADESVKSQREDTIKGASEGDIGSLLLLSNTMNPSMDSSGMGMQAPRLPSELDNKMLDLFSGGMVTSMDQACVGFREGHISLSAKKSLTDHALIRGSIVLGVSLATSMFGGWLGGVVGKGLGLGAGSLGLSLFSSSVAGGLTGLSVVWTQDIYNYGVRSSTNDRFVRAYSPSYGFGDYASSAGVGAAMGIPFGLLHYAGSGPRPGIPGEPPIVPGEPGKPVIMMDAGGRMIRVQGGQALPLSDFPVPLTLESNAPPVRVQGGQVLPGPAPRIYLPNSGVPDVDVVGLDTATAAAEGRLNLVDLQGRPLRYAMSPSGRIQVSMPSTETLLGGETRLVGPDGKPLSGQVPSPAPGLLDAQGKPLTAPQTGPTIVDLQAGTPAALRQMVTQTPGARGLGVEPGNWLLAYQRMYPTDPGDLQLAMMLARNSPVWPETPAFQTTLGGMPRALPWEMDPASHLFPQEGPVRMLTEPLNPMLGRSFFSPLGGAMEPHVSRQIPFAPGDITGFGDSPIPELAGQADQIYLRRGFGLALANQQETALMGQRMGAMLKPGGNAFIEIRSLDQFGAAVKPGAVGEPAAPAGAGPTGIDQPALIAEQIPGAKVERVTGAQVKAYRTIQQLEAVKNLTGELDPAQRSSLAAARRNLGSPNPRQLEMLRGAMNDTEGLGEGGYKSIVRIYRE